MAEDDIFVPLEVIYTTTVESTVITLSYSLFNEPLEFPTMIHRVVSDFSFFSGCLEICPEPSIPLIESIAHLSRHYMYPLSLPSEVMRRVSTALHLLIAFDDITTQLANCNDNYIFSTCPYSVL